MNISADALAVVILVISILIGMGRGFAAASKNAISTIAVIVIMICFTMPVSNLLMASPIAGVINDSVIKSVYGIFQEHSAASGMENVVRGLGLPNFVTDRLLLQADYFASTEETIAASISQSLTAIILKAVSSIAIFILAQIIVNVVFLMIKGLLEIPAFEKMDKFMGFIMGAVNALLIIYIICGLIVILTPLEKQQAMNSFIHTTYIVRYFYDNNYLLKLFI